LVDAVRPAAFLLLALSLFGCCATLSRGQEADSEASFLPGLVLEQESPQGNTGTQVEPGIALQWRPSTESPGEPPSAWTWRGAVRALTAGEYWFAAELTGDATFSLDGQVLLRNTATTAAIFTSDPIQLEFGEHPVQVELRPIDQGTVEMRMFWRGPGFSWEPLRAPHLVHADRVPSSGAELAETLRCGACHASDVSRVAPSLTKLSGALNPDWLVERLSSEDVTTGVDRQSQARPYGAQMPNFAMPREDALAIATYLGVRASKEDNPAIEGSRDQGEDLFLTLGCLACHRVGEIGFSGPYGGGALDEVGSKRPATFFEAWLRNPESLNSRHRMPVFELSDEERRHLAAYLASLRGKQLPKVSAADFSNVAKRQQGQALIQRYRCGACHEMGSEIDRPAPLPLVRLGEVTASTACLGGSNVLNHRPGYRLSESTATRLLAHLREPGSAMPSQDGHARLRRSNCLGCHARQGATAGLAERSQELATQKPNLAARIPALLPPALDGIGDKLTDAVLEKSVAGEGPRRRSWLEVRMPRFPFTEEERESLAHYFRQQDRVPDSLCLAPVEIDEASAKVAGRRLVTSDGFGCTSCHQIGSVVPDQVQIRARGTQLNGVAKHLRRSWFDRFVRAPTRIVPQMEMPSIQLPVRGVLDEQLDQQLAAVWTVLRDERFEPPQPNPIRVVRQANDANRPGRAVLMTDLIQVNREEFIKPLVVGLPNRHNVLFDLATQRLAAWWTGDTALQRTRKKSWYWESGGPTLWQSPRNSTSEVEVYAWDDWHAPALRGQFVSEFDWYEHRAGGIAVGQVLLFTAPNATGELTAQLQQSFQPLWVDAQGCSGLVREIVLKPDDPSASWRFLVGKNFEVDAANSDVARGENLAGDLTVRIVAPEGATWQATNRGPAAVLPAEAEQRLVLKYLTKLAVDRHEHVETIAGSHPPRLLDAMPGFQAVELPLDPQVMPTGLAWRDDGALWVTSLKGQVLRAIDRDGDGCEDCYQSLGVELASPYGLSPQGDHLDVINKYALVRLKDQDGDGLTDRVERLASGWGHTEDYHDWAVGLPRDDEGNYYLALPCQQDRRTEAESRLRGQALRLRPQPSSSTYQIESICRGLRFPMGLLWHPRWGLLCTDNQGNYTPFNELNRLLPERHYGFINRNERETAEPANVELPVVEIPHPWTRSVNGICVLDTPASLQSRGISRFGPWEGHLLGCEYDTRRLVRMSLETVGNQLQGAVYPASLEPRDGVPSFEGPLVCQVSPRGDIYVGNIRDSGWGGGANTGSIVRLRPTGEWPLGIAEIKALPRGFAIHFTGPVPNDTFVPGKAIAMVSFRRQRTPEYGGPDLDRSTIRISAQQWSDDRRKLEIELTEMKVGYVYEFHVGEIGPGGARLFPDEAYYTLRAIPSGGGGERE